MAARSFLQRGTSSPLAVGALFGLALTPTTVFAEAPNDYKRKPIYDSFDAPPANPVSQPSPTLLPSEPDDKPNVKKPSGPSPTERIAVQVGNARGFLYKCALATETKLNNAMDSAFNLEQSFTNTVASLAPPRESGEKLMPGTIYVLVAAMAGSILTRNRNILLRAAFPLGLGIGAGWVVIPITMRNISDLAWKYEERYPVVADSHLRFREAIRESWSSVRSRSEGGAQYVGDKVTDARETVEGWVKEGK